MDSNAKAVFINATHSSGPLELNLPTVGGPINLLPNEMMQLVLDRVNSDGDVKKLVRLRLVAAKWNSLIEHYCKQKRSLIVNDSSFFTSDLDNSASQIVSLKSADFFGPMLELFPNIEQLAIRDRFHYADFNGTRFYPLEDMKIRDFAAKINSLTSLKRLELRHNDLEVVPHLSQTLSRLENILVEALPQPQFIYTEMNQFISHLGSSCVRVFLGENPKLHYSQVREWHNINPSWLANLTHLEFFTEFDDENGVQILYFLSGHSTRLQTLKYTSYDKDAFEVTPTLIDALGNLTNLTELYLFNIEMDIPELDQAASQRELTSLSSVLDCFLCITDGRPSKGDKFARVLSAIFPNLTDLHLVIDKDFSTSRQFLRVVKQNVHLFPNLRNHKIEFV